jgi:hypothetical protein
VTFVTTSVASLMLDPTCFVLGLPLGTFILTHVLVKCHLEAFVTLFRSSRIFYQNRILRFTKSDESSFDRLASTLLLLNNQLYCDLFLYNQSTFSKISFFVFQRVLLGHFFLLGYSDEKCHNVEHSKHLI